MQTDNQVKKEGKLTIAEVLEQERGYRKWKKKKMAEFLGISSSYYGQLVSGTREGFNIIQKLSEKLNRPIEDFYDIGRGTLPKERSDPAMMERIRNLEELKEGYRELWQQEREENKKLLEIIDNLQAELSAIKKKPVRIK